MFNPFLNTETNEIVFSFKPTRDVVFLLPCQAPEQLGSLIIPEEYRDNYRNEYGIILAVGPGCYIEKFKKYIPTTVKVGEVAIYDPGTPWGIDVISPVDNQKYWVKYMGERDLSGVIRS